MPDTPTPTPPATPEPEKSPRSRSFISREITEAMELAEQCRNAAAEPANATALASRQWTAAEQATLDAHCQAARRLEQSITDARARKGSLSTGEAAAQEELLEALEPIAKAARLTFPDDRAQRIAFGQNLGSASPATLLRHATYGHEQLQGPNPKITLIGLRAEEISALAALVKKYGTADWAHNQAQQQASTLLAELEELTTGDLKRSRRRLQLTADLQWPHRDPVNAALRKTFGLQPDRPLSAN